MKIWFDGKLVDRDEAKVSVFDHGVLYGDGCFEGIRFYSGKVFRLEEHIVRLFNSMRYLMIELPWSFEEVCEATKETVAASGMEDGYIRLVVTRGVGDLGLNPLNCPKASMFIIVQNIALYPKEMYEKGLMITVVSMPSSVPRSCAYSNTMASSGVLPVRSPMPNNEQLTPLAP